MANRTIGTEIKLTGEKEFNDQMKAINSGLKTTKSEMALVSAEFADNAGSVAALTAKQKVLQDSVDQQRTKVELLRAQYEKSAAALGENAGKTQAYKQQLNYATAALAKETSALEKNSDAIKQAELKAKVCIPVTQRLASSVKDSGTRIKDFTSNVKDSARNTPVLSEVLDALKVGAKGAGLAIKGTKTAVSALGTASMGAAKGLAKGVGAITAISAASVAAAGALGVAALTTLTGYAREAAEAAKQAKDAGEELTSSQQMWLDYAGQLDALDASVANAKAALGGVLLPILSDLSTEGAAFLNDFTRDMEAAAGDTEKQGQVMADYIVKGANLIKQKLPEYIKVGKEVLGGLLQGLSENGDELLDMGFDLVMDLLDGIIQFAPEIATGAVSLIEKLMTGLTERGPDLITSAVGMVTQIVTGLAQAAPDLIPMAAQLVTQLFTALVEAAPDLLLAGLELIYGIVSGVTSGLGDIVSSAGDIIETISTAFGDKVDDFLSIGGDIVKGIWDGISAGTEWIFEKISGWVDDVVEWIKGLLGIKSPSRVMKYEVGFWMARGVGEGFAEEMDAVNKQIANSINTSFNLPEFTFSGGGYRPRSYSTSSGKVVNLYFTAKTITEAEISMVIDLVNRKLGDAIA